jgi:hypothetical protein
MERRRRSGRNGLRLLGALVLPLCAAGSQGPAARPATAADPLVADPRQAQEVLAAAYHERARIGLGSPFRLIDLVLHDHRLSGQTRLRVARGILRTTRRGDGYRLDPVVLDRVVNLHAGPRPGTGIQHLQLIAEAISGAADPRAGEMAVRLAYGLAALEGAIDSMAFQRAITAAALLRDREAARRDAGRLAAAAHARGTDAVDLIPEWRRARRFQVEQPAMLPVPASSIQKAVERAPRLLASIRAIGNGPAGRPAPATALTALSATSARALYAIAARDPLPPQTAIAVRVRNADRHFRAPTSEAARAWASFAEETTNEEEFIAHRTILLQRAPELRGEVARLTLLAALDLRTFAQEPPWFPPMGGPSARELRQRHGVRLDLASGVPPAWAPYYRRMLDVALAHMKHAMPRLDVRGLTVRVTREAESGLAIARYNPRTRVIEWPASTGPGTLAHEVAHDVDRQAAVRLYGVRGRYASDRAARSGKDPLAPALETLAESSRAISRQSHPHALRPREVFARNMDWHVTRTLARMGLSNGYVSSAQDELLTGHGTVRPPGSPESYGRALRMVVRALVSPAKQAPHASEHWRPTPAAVLRIFAAAAPRTAEHVIPGFTPAFDELRAARTSTAAVLERWICASEQPFTDWQLFTAYRRLLADASAAHARRLAVETAARAGGTAAAQALLRELDATHAASPGAPTPGWVVSLVAEVRSFREWETPTQGPGRVGNRLVWSTLRLPARGAFGQGMLGPLNHGIGTASVRCTAGA